MYSVPGQNEVAGCRLAESIKRVLFFCLVVLAPAVLASCHGHGGGPSNVSTSDDRTKVRTLTVAELVKLRVNEDGVIPILEYHDISKTESRWARSVARFKGDLERLYKEGYRPITISDYINNHIATPAGQSPVLLTFDDARESQFRYLADGSIDPDCAIGILQSFHNAHPDFPGVATFYILPDSAFGESSTRAKKLQALLAMGCDLGNHTIHHERLDKMDDATVQQELANCAAEIVQMAPAARVDTIALPYGVAPRNRGLLAAGSFQGRTYRNLAALLVGAQPALAPTSRRMRPFRLPRVQAIEGLDGITFWLDSLKRHPNKRYISDGDPGTVSVPSSEAADVDQDKLVGAKVRTY